MGSTPPVFPGPEWWSALTDAIAASPEYRQVGAEWEGDISFVIEAEPDKGVPTTVCGWLDLWRGECRAGRWDVPRAEAEEAPFVISAPYTRWKLVIRGELEPVKAMMQGKITVHGDLPAIIRNVKAANELVVIASRLPVRFVDEDDD